jgi:hypothetical protein
MSAPGKRYDAQRICQKHHCRRRRRSSRQLVAEIDFWMGEEMEKHTITSTTVIFIPKGLMHSPLNFRTIRKPVLFHALYLGPNLDRQNSIPNFDLTTFDWGGPVNLKTFGPPRKK